MTKRASHRALFASRRLTLAAGLAICGSFVLAHALPIAHADAPAPYRILIHPDNPAQSLSRELTTQFFLKRTTRWSDGEIVHPVDQRGNAEVRRNFSEAILKRSVAAVKRYWQQRIFSGRDLPPPELDNDEAVVEYVLKHRGAIGYVSRTAKLDRAKSLRVE